MDYNGDGIGDIKGIESKLEYIKSLGCNAIWINPCFDSPFQDAGYDVSDFYKIAPRYGTNADIKRLFNKAKSLDIRILLDLVPGHTSIQHPWFKESCKAEKNKYTNWFIWTDSVWHDAGNLKSISGYAERDGQYVSNFFWFQPALNYGFANPDPSKKWQLPVSHPDVLALKKEIKNIMRFWLDMGAAGFRVDMASSIVKNDDQKKSATSAFWREIRKMLDKEYPEAVLVAEWGDPEISINNAGFHMDFLLPFVHPVCNNLFRNGEKSFFSPLGNGDITTFLDYYTRAYANTKEKGYICIFSGNHDLERISLLGNEDAIKNAFVFILTMPGIPFIYYGDEIGMKQQRNLVSKEGGYNRTGARTPMQWNSSQKNSGFSSAEAKKLYLPIDKSKSAPSVATQEKNPDSLLNFVRKLCHIRRENPILGARPDFIPLYALKDKYPFVFMRKEGTKKALVALNPSSKPALAKFANPGFELKTSKILLQKGAQIKIVKNTIQLKMESSSYFVISNA